MKVKSKVWLEKGRKLAFGLGKTLILKKIQETGSISKAAKAMKMSYRHAWSYICSVEKRLGFPLLIQIKGGKGGGGAVLTQQAKDVLDKFEKLERQVREFSDKSYKKIFGK